MMFLWQKHCFVSPFPLCVSPDGKLCTSYHRGLISKAKIKAIKYSIVIILGKQSPSSCCRTVRTLQKQACPRSWWWRAHTRKEFAGTLPLSDWRGMRGIYQSIYVSFKGRQWFPIPPFMTIVAHQTRGWIIWRKLIKS